MPERQTQPISPPRPGDENNLIDFSSVVQDNFKQLFQLVHRHSLKSSAPAANEGNVGDIFLVESSGTFSLYVKFPSGWKSTTLT